MTEQQISLVNELAGTKCRCGRGKVERQTFCIRCYRSLPKEMQRSLYRRLGFGYEEAYSAATAFLAESDARWASARAVRAS